MKSSRSCHLLPWYREGYSQRQQQTRTQQLPVFFQYFGSQTLGMDLGVVVVSPDRWCSSQALLLICDQTVEKRLGDGISSHFKPDTGSALPSCSKSEDGVQLPGDPPHRSWAMDVGHKHARPPKKRRINVQHCRMLPESFVGSGASKESIVFQTVSARPASSSLPDCPSREFNRTSHRNPATPFVRANTAHDILDSSKIRGVVIVSSSPAPCRTDAE